VLAELLIRAVSDESLALGHPSLAYFAASSSFHRRDDQGSLTAVFVTFREHVLEVLGRVGRACRRFVQGALGPKSGAATGPGRGLITDLARSKMELVVENAFLRQQLLVAGRHVKKPGFRMWDRLILLILAAVLANWRSALILVKPETLLRWHRDVFRLIWRWRSRRNARAKPRLSTEMVSLIRRMATQNRLWGAERIAASF
jgi:hypothetical protein